MRSMPVFLYPAISAAHLAYLHFTTVKAHTLCALKKF